MSSLLRCFLKKQTEMRAGEESMQRVEISWELVRVVGLENRKGMLRVNSNFFPIFRVSGLNSGFLVS